jgi:membrane protease YdiL (CAAX protease family)
VTCATGLACDDGGVNESDGRVRGPARVAVIEAVGAALVASVLAGVFYRLQGISVVRANLHAFVAAVFLFLPQLMLRKRGELEAYGLRSQPVKLGLSIAGMAVVVVLPLFTLGFVAWNRLMCAHWPAAVPGSCWHLLHPSFRLPPAFATMALAQLVVVALPEELFFRGYVQGRLEDALPAQRKLFGAPFGWAIVIQAALFGVGHFLVTFEPAMLTRFFPGLLFGWMYARTRSILASTIFHAACNLLVEVIASSML